MDKETEVLLMYLDMSPRDALKKEAADKIRSLSKLDSLVKEFVLKHKISCPECIHQDDDVITNAYEFIEALCNEVGYFKDDEDE